MMGPIVIEGPDGAGKTALANAILLKMPGHRVKNGPPPPGATRGALLALYASQLVPGAVIDRSWLSEMIYGPRLRGRSLLGRRDYDALAGALADAGGMMIVCLPPFAACLAARRTGRPELLPDEGALRDVWESYAGWVRLHPPLVAAFDWTAPGATEKLLGELAR